MIIFIFTTIILLIMVSLTVINKQVAKFTYKDLFITDIGSIEYNSKMFNKKAEVGGVVPKQTNIKLNLKYVNFTIKYKIIKNKPVEKLEKMFYESYNYINKVLFEKDYNFNNVLYINNYCRVIYIANAILKEYKYKVDDKAIENFINSYNIELSYNEVINLANAFKYQIAVIFNEIAKFILYQNKVKNKAKKDFNKKYINSVVYCYYYGKYTEKFEDYHKNFSQKYISYDEIVSKYFNIINDKIYSFYSLISTLKFLENYNSDYLYFGYQILANNQNTCSYNYDKKQEIFMLNSQLSIDNNLDEKQTLYKVLEYAKILGEDVYFLLTKNDKKLVSYLLDEPEKISSKKKL